MLDGQLEHREPRSPLLGTQSDEQTRTCSFNGRSEHEVTEHGLCPLACQHVMPQDTAAWDQLTQFN